MKSILLIVAMTLAAGAARAQTPQPDYGLPDLHKIKTVTLSPSYSCRSKEDFQKGYENTALFLSAFSQQRNSPDLLFNGACGSVDYFQSSTAGDDMALIADLGTIALEEVTAHLAFNTRNVFVFKKLSRFANSVPVTVGDTYAVLINKREIRGLLIFTVTGHVLNKQVDLRYAVKEYQILDVKAQSPGFDWERRSEQ